MDGGGQRPAFRELAIHTWQVNCDGCDATLDFEFAVDATLGNPAREAAAQARIAELGWQTRAGQHLCPNCQKETAA